MIQLSDEQRLHVQQGKPVRVLAMEIGAECVVVRADVFERLRSLLEEDDGPDMRTVARLIERNMREDDANDPLLASYQDSGSQP
jgi:hypothetical protein